MCFEVARTRIIDEVHRLLALLYIVCAHGDSNVYATVAYLRCSILCCFKSATVKPRHRVSRQLFGEASCRKTVFEHWPSILRVRGLWDTQPETQELDKRGLTFARETPRINCGSKLDLCLTARRREDSTSNSKASLMAPSRVVVDEVRTASEMTISSGFFRVL